jgi:AraC-like DNA-binding protein
MRQLSNFEHLIGGARRPETGPRTVRKRRARPRRQVHTSLDAADIDRLIQMYLSGTPINDLADQFAIHRTTVMQHIRRSGVPRRQHVLADQVDEARQLYERGWSLAQIGQHFDFHASTVRLALLKANVRIRDSQGRDRS